MSTLDQLKRDLKKMIATNIAGNALKKLEQTLNDNADCYNTFIILTMDFKRLGDRQFLGENVNSELNGLMNRLLKFIDDLEEAHLKPTAELQEEIFERILVVCKSKEREAFMRNLFPTQYWKGIAYDIEQPRPIAEINQFNLIIFDNSPFDKEDTTLLKYYLDQTTPYLLYFGSTLPLLYEKPYEGKVYSTNFVFSIHARIFEMINYFKYTRAAEPNAITPSPYSPITQ